MKTDINEIIIYNTDDGKAEIKIILDSETQTIWLTQNQMADLFDVSVKTANEHLINIYKEGELEEGRSIRKFRMVRREGLRDVTREITHYNLKAILAVGYRVRSARGVQFRRWATDHLNEYLVKGFVMNDQRLKDPDGWDYFDELLERIRDIRTSEKRFYQKIKDLFSQTTADYNKASTDAREFFATIQNKLIYAETGMTAAELVIARADANKTNMGLTNWSGDKVRKKDIVVSKNYLKKEEIEHLNRLVTMFLDFSEDRVRKRQEILMKDWLKQTESFVADQYEEFQENRKQEALKISDEENIAELEKTMKEIETKEIKRKSL